jgi:hypothetical protein
MLIPALIGFKLLYQRKTNIALRFGATPFGLMALRVGHPKLWLKIVSQAWGDLRANLHEVSVVKVGEVEAASRHQSSCTYLCTS